MKRAKKNNEETQQGDFEELYKSAAKFLVPLTSKDTYPIIVEQARKLVDAKFCTIYLKSGSNLIKVYASSPKLVDFEIRKNGYTWRAFKSGKSNVISVDKVEKFHPKLKDMGVKSVIYIPLLYKKKSIGVLSADSFEAHAFDKTQLNTLRLFGSMAMLAIRKSQLHDALEESLKTRDLFISLASHELRSPLTTINSYSTLIEKTLAKGVMPDYKWVKVLRDEVARIILMVNELLQLDSIKTGKLQYDWQSHLLHEVLKRAVVNFKAKYKDRELSYINRLKNDKGEVLADFDKLLQAVLNVLNNAAKFSNNDTPISLSLNFRKPYYIVEISDRGNGVAKSDMGRIFEGFYKGKNSTKEGIGLGLYLTKSIIEMHRGRIDVNSREGEGTSIELLIPRA